MSASAAASPRSSAACCAAGRERPGAVRHAPAAGGGAGRLAVVDRQGDAQRRDDVFRSRCSTARPASSEIARMLGGVKITDDHPPHAAEMLGSLNARFPEHAEHRHDAGGDEDAGAIQRISFSGRRLRQRFRRPAPPARWPASCRAWCPSPRPAARHETARRAPPSRTGSCRPFRR
jgi:hypothetical protein